MKITRLPKENRWDFLYRCAVEIRGVGRNVITALNKPENNPTQWFYSWIEPIGQHHREPNRFKFANKDNVTHKRLDGTTGLTNILKATHPIEGTYTLAVDIYIHPEKAHFRKVQLKVPNDGGGEPTHSQAMAFKSGRCILQMIGNWAKEKIIWVRLIDLTQYASDRVVYANVPEDKTRYYVIIKDSDPHAQWHPIVSRLGMVTPLWKYLPEQIMRIVKERGGSEYTNNTPTE